MVDARLKFFFEFNQWFRSYTNNNSPVILAGDFSLPIEKLKKYYISKHFFVTGMVAKLSGNNITFAKGSNISYIDHIIYNKAMVLHVHLLYYCSFLLVYLILKRPMTQFPSTTFSISFQNFILLPK
jgi:hypothetical protein